MLCRPLRNLVVYYCLNKGSNEMKPTREVNLYFLITVVVSFTLQYIPFEKITTNTGALLLIGQIAIALPAIVFLIHRREPLRISLRIKKIAPGNIVLLILFVFLMMPLMTMINAISLKYVENSTRDVMSSLVLSNPLWLSLLLVAVVPCILEETVYRGVFYNEYRKNGLLAGALLSAVLFGVMHGNFNQFSYAFVMGILFTFMIEATDSLVSSILMHFMINAQSVILLSLLPKMVTWLQSTYETALANGNQTMSDSIASMLDGMDITSPTLANDLLGTSVELTYSEIVRLYAFPVIICTILAFLVFKTIARNNGRWDGIVAKLTGKRIEDRSENSVDTGNDMTETNQNDKQDEKQKILPALKENITIPLIIGISICVAGMILNEIL